MQKLIFTPILLLTLLISQTTEATTPTYTTQCAFKAIVVSTTNTNSAYVGFTLNIRLVDARTQNQIDIDVCKKLANITVNGTWNTLLSDAYEINHSIYRNQIIKSGSVIQGNIDSGTYTMSNIGLVPEEIPIDFVAPTVTPSVNKFTRPLKLGMRGSDVKDLQILLNTEGNTLPTTGYFGPATQQAVIRFQNKYASQILTPSGLTRGTGYFGMASIKVANELAYIVF